MVAPVASRADNLQKLKHTANDAQVRPTLPESAFMVMDVHVDCCYMHMAAHIET